MIDTPNLEINQSASIGASSMQIGVVENNQHYHIGMSPEEAVKTAITMFREYYPQLKQEALADVERMVAEKLDSIPPENIVAPSPRIAVPTLQNASITEETDIRKMYANLLANSMNSVVKKGVHPGFVEIIKQLSPDEAKIMNYIFAKKAVPTITLRYENEKGDGMDIVNSFSNIGELVKCEYPLQINTYFNNLIRLGLLERSQTSSLSDKSLYEPLKSHPHVASQANQAQLQKEYNRVKFKESYIFITDYGKAFCEICIANIITIELPPIPGI